MRVAIIGAGFCGLATTWHLLNSSIPLSEIVLFDRTGIGGGASGIAAGLLHPYSGAHAKLNRFGKEGMESTLELLRVAASFTSKKVFQENGFFRPACTPSQKEDFLLAAKKYPQDIEWFEIEEMENKFPFPSSLFPGIWIKRGFTVFSKNYLEGLWQACIQKGAIFEKKGIKNWEELSDFDLKVATTGSNVTEFCKQLSITLVKGQILEFQWPKEYPPIPYPINSHAYVMMGENQQTCLVGATYERDFSKTEPDLEVAVQEIFPKILPILPCLKSASIQACYAGIRVSTPTHLPLIKKVGEGNWIFTGMGSKGLLYHSLFAKKLVESIVGFNPYTSSYTASS